MIIDYNILEKRDKYKNTYLSLRLKTEHSPITNILH